MLALRTSRTRHVLRHHLVDEHEEIAVAGHQPANQNPS